VTPEQLQSVLGLAKWMAALAQSGGPVRITISLHHCSDETLALAERAGGWRTPLRGPGHPADVVSFTFSGVIVDFFGPHQEARS